jgi:hypothetical protein
MWVSAATRRSLGSHSIRVNSVFAILFQSRRISDSGKGQNDVKQPLAPYHDSLMRAQSWVSGVRHQSIYLSRLGFPRISELWKGAVQL